MALMYLLNANNERSLSSDEFESFQRHVCASSTSHHGCTATEIKFVSRSTFCFLLFALTMANQQSFLCTGTYSILGLGYHFLYLGKLQQRRFLQLSCCLANGVGCFAGLGKTVSAETERD